MFVDLFFFARCSVTKPATGYLYISWLTFKVRCKSMQGFLYCSVDFEEWCHHLSSDFMILMIIIANNHQMPRGRGGIIACIHTSLSETELKGWEREREMRQKAWKQTCQCGLIGLSIHLSKDIVVYAGETLFMQIAQRSERRSKPSPFLSEVQNHAY